MACDFKPIIASLDEAIAKASAEAAEILGAKIIDWESLNWSKTGASTLFTEFKQVGAWCDRVTNRSLVLEHYKHMIVGSFNDQKILLEKQREAVIKKNAKTWVMSGFAYQEREALARIETGDEAYDIVVIERKLEQLNGILDLLKRKAAQLSGFKMDARAASSMMNFGHAIGEL